MFEIDRIPASVLRVMSDKGVQTESILLAAYCDRDTEQRPADTYLLATQKELFVLCGAVDAVHNEFSERSFVRYEIADLHHFQVEELLSAGRLTAKQGEENVPVFLASFTNFCKASVFLFAKYAQKIVDDGSFELDPKDNPADRYCPKCGMRYPDVNRRICPRCMEKGKLFRRFSVFLLRYKLYLTLAVISLSLMTAASILAPYLSSGFFYDQVIFGTGEFAGQLLTVLFLVVGTRVLKTLTSIIHNYVTSAISAHMVFDLKKTIFQAIERLSISFFTGRQTGGLMTQINEDSNTIYSFFCDQIPYFAVSIVEVAVVGVLLFCISPLLAALSLLTVPVFLVMMRWLFRNQKRLHQKQQW